MTIRRSVNIAAINTDYGLFLDGTENAPAGMFTQAVLIADMIGDFANEFLRTAKDAIHLNVDNCDGIREIEAMMFAMLREKNPDSQIEQAIGLGRALDHASEKGSSVTKADILGRLVADRTFIQSQRDADVDALLGDVFGLTTIAQPAGNITGTIASVGGAQIAPPTAYQAACAALMEGQGELWMVRVENSFDEMDYVELEVRAEIMEDAAVKAEAHATAYADMYFDIGAKPTFGAVRREIYRIDEDGDQMIAPTETAVQQADKTWAIMQGAAFIKGGFTHQYQAEVKIADRVREWEEAHGLREPEQDDSEDRFAGSDAPFPGQEA